MPVNAEFLLQVLPHLYQHHTSLQPTKFIGEQRERDDEPKEADRPEISSGTFAVTPQEYADP